MEEAARKAQGALLADPRTSTGRIRVREEPNALVLEGEVADLGQRRAALRVARQAVDQRTVIDHLNVPQTPGRTDQEIARHLWDAYDQDPAIDSRLIRIRVQDGRVKLEGQADNLVARKLAGVMAWWEPGVRDVDNQLVVPNSEPDDDNWLLETIDVVLDKDFLITRGSVMFSVKQGVVRLTGAVPSPEIKRAAENDMWAIEGVCDVVNELTIEPQQTSVEFR